MTTNLFSPEFLQLIGGLVIFSALCYTIYSILKILPKNKKTIEEATSHLDYIKDESAAVATCLIQHEVDFRAIVAIVNPTIFVIRYPLHTRYDDNAVDRLLLAQAYSRLNMFQEGRECFEESVAKYPELSKWKEHDPLIGKLYK